MSAAWEQAEGRVVAATPARTGVYLEFASSADFPLSTKSLEDRRRGIRLLNVRQEGEQGQEKTLATIYVPRSESGHFVRRIEEFRDKETKPSPKGESKPQNQNLVASIEDVRVALLGAFWTDDRRLMPKEDKTWIEVWLSTTSVEILDGFRGDLAEIGVPEHPHHPEIKFPERTVLLVRANGDDLLKLIDRSDYLAELRAGREPASYFTTLDNKEEAEWTKNLLERLDHDLESKVSVCILDCGVNRGHPLLEPLLSDDDTQAIDPTWGTAGNGPHGTQMAGLSAFGDLQAALVSSDRIVVRHRLESVKVLPPPPGANARNLWGSVTSQGISRSEIQAPGRNRVVCMAITTKETACAGRPTSWSAAVDQLATNEGGANRRLILVSTGNTDNANYCDYPASNFTDQVQDPAQAWNALAIGGMTNLVRIANKDYFGYLPLAPVGALAPCSCTSVAWDSGWPLKPDVVFEAGNKASLQRSIESPDEFQVLTTWHEYTQFHFAPFDGTSAATAQAAWFAAQLWAEYEEAWPETIRGLIVHSANWTDEMLKARSGPGKSSFEQILRSVGFGQPNLDTALHCLRNKLTLVLQQTLRPFARRSGGDVGTNEIHLHSLPWPKEVLQELGEVQVTMRVTLSYFIEPGPGEIGWKDKYRYPSHGLRFDLNSPSESKVEFMKRINVAARGEGERRPSTPSSAGSWTLGSNLRDRGSIHSDIWTGRAADLAASSFLAVFPTTGWWKERTNLEKFDSDARYSLIVSIHSPLEEVDLYTPVMAAIRVPIEVQIDTTSDGT